VHVLQGLRQALVLLLLSLAFAAAVAGLWVALRGGGFLRAWGGCCVLLGPLIAISGGTELSREMTMDARAFLGAGPDREAAGESGHLTPVGVFLLVSVPLVVAGGLLLDARS
jgi:hypothetical protein